jgi:hypothetical protein
MPQARLIDPLRGYRGFSRLHPVRRLTPEECDLVGYEGPLILSAQQVRWLVGPWRTKGYTVSHNRRGVLMVCSKAELRDLGIDVDA